MRRGKEILIIIVSHSHYCHQPMAIVVRIATHLAYTTTFRSKSILEELKVFVVDLVKFTANFLICHRIYNHLFFFNGIGFIIYSCRYYATKSSWFSAHCSHCFRTTFIASSASSGGYLYFFSNRLTRRRILARSAYLRFQSIVRFFLSRYSSRYGEIRKCKNTTKSLFLRTNFSFIFEHCSKNEDVNHSHA